jgi:hypothetical protein
MGRRAIGSAIVAGLLVLTSVNALRATDGQAGGVGIVHRGELDDLRLTIANDAMPLGSKVAIVTSPDGVVLCCAIVGAPYILPPDEFDPVHLDSEGQTTYALDPARIGADVAFGFGLADVAPMVASGTTLDLDGNGTPEGFRTCASGEGLHLTVWYGEPLATARLWHGYFYLGYDTEADCAPQDYE